MKFKIHILLYLKITFVNIFLKFTERYNRKKPFINGHSHYKFQYKYN